MDHRNHRVQKFSRDGRSLGAWGEFGSGDGQFNLPWGITQDREGFLYVADWRNDRIQKFTPDGGFVARFGASGSGDGQLNRPSGLAVDCGRQPLRGGLGQPARPGIRRRNGNYLLQLRGEAHLSPWAQEYIEANADELAARGTYVPVFDVDTDAADEVSARIEPYFWDPVDVVLDAEQRVYVLETSRHRFQIYEKA